MLEDIHNQHYVRNSDTQDNLGYIKTEITKIMLETQINNIMLNN